MTEPRATARSDERIFEDEDPELADNQEFDHALAEGTESLAHGKPEEARGALEKALRYKPRNQRARNLLGLSLFKLGQLQRAEEIYRGLIEDHPADPTLRVNLGLVFLKSNSSAEAVRCFETALDLTPTHQKAQNYLGLALAQKGELLRAREWFLKAGNEAMAQRMAQALQQSPIRDVAASAEEALASENPFKPAASEDPPLSHSGGEAQKHWVASTPAQPAAPPIGSVVAPEPSSLPAVTPAEAVEEAVATAGEPSALSMSEYTLNTRLSVPSGPNGDGGGFVIGANEVLVQVKGEMLTRLDGLVASWGQVTMKPEMKRFRGKATDKPFGDGSRRMLRAAGEGRFVVAREGRRFTALELGDEPAYFREETLFAFEESILFENGRVPSKGGPDLHLVHLRGRGKLLLVTAFVPQAVDVLRGEPLRVPMEQLVGWHGPLIQPRLVQIVEDTPEMGVALELNGEGRALLDVPATR